MAFRGRVLVTGADGFIGSHLVQALVEEGIETRAFTLYNSLGARGWLDDLPNEISNSVDFFIGDVRDPNGVRTAMKGCSGVLHLAALISIPFSYHSPDAYVDTNVKGTLNVLQAARDLEPERVVVTSTSEVYGTAQYVPMDEKHPCVGQSPYSATKIAADQLAVSFWRSFQLPVTILRPFNTYGPRQSLRAVIPTIIAQIASGRRRIELGLLSPTRDFTFVSDTCAGFKAALTAPNAPFGEAVNLASEFEISIGDLVKTIADIIGVEVEVVAKDERMRPPNSEVERLFADASRAKALLGWKPSHAGLDGFREGVRKTAEWFAEPANLTRYRPEAYHV